MFPSMFSVVCRVSNSVDGAVDTIEFPGFFTNALLIQHTMAHPFSNVAIT